MANNGSANLVPLTGNWIIHCELLLKDHRTLDIRADRRSRQIGLFGLHR